MLLKLTLREVKFFYILLESLLDELPNINNFISKSILFKINSTKVEQTRITYLNVNNYM